MPGAHAAMSFEAGLPNVGFFDFMRGRGVNASLATLSPPEGSAFEQAMANALRKLTADEKDLTRSTDLLGSACLLLRQLHTVFADLPALFASVRPNAAVLGPAECDPELQAISESYSAVCNSIGALMSDLAGRGVLRVVDVQRLLAELRALRSAALPQGDVHREQDKATVPLVPADETKRAVVLLLDHAYPAALKLHRGLTSHLFVNMRRSAGKTQGQHSTQVKPASVVRVVPVRLVPADKRDGEIAVVDM